MISDAERNYQTRNWIPAQPSDLQGRKSIDTIEMMRTCTSDSQRFKDMCLTGRGDRAFLIDYEILSLDYSPTSGSSITRSEDGRLILTIFTPTGSDSFIEKP